VLEVGADQPVWPQTPTWETPAYSGRGRPPEPRPVEGERREVSERAAALPPRAWGNITVAEGAQGPRTYCFARERVRETREGEPGKELWLLHRKNRDGSEPRWYLSNAPEEEELERLAQVSAARWPIETEFQVTKDEIGLDQYEVRSWRGWHHHITLCLLANAFLLTLEQEWGGKGAGDHSPAGVSAGAGTLAAEALHKGGPAPVAGGNPGAERARPALPPPSSRPATHSRPLNRRCSTSGVIAKRL